MGKEKHTSAQARLGLGSMAAAAVAASTARFLKGLPAYTLSMGLVGLGLGSALALRGARARRLLGEASMVVGAEGRVEGVVVVAGRDVDMDVCAKTGIIRSTAFLPQSLCRRQGDQMEEDGV